MVGLCGVAGPARAQQSPEETPAAEAAGAPRPSSHPREDAAQAAALRAMLETEKELMHRDRQDYAAAREQERSAVEEVEEATQNLDAALAGTAADSLETLESLDVRRRVARATAEIFSSRAEELRRNLLERTRHLATLEGRLARFAGILDASDPITGRWSVTIASPRQSGTFQLRLDGTVVSGTYEMEGGRRGSVRGTYVGKMLRIERIDTSRGLDGVLEGEVEVELGLARGFYSPTLLSEGGPGGAGWTGVRVSTEFDREEPSETADVGGIEGESR